jgi:ornithine cyclodeaminase
MSAILPGGDDGLPFLDAQQVAHALPWAQLIDALRRALLTGDTTSPPRLQYDMQHMNAGVPTLLLMPAWSPTLGVGSKLVTVYPNNARVGLPSVQGLYVLMEPNTGRPQAVLDGGELTARRTAAASALASRYLSRADSHCLVMVGTGRLSQHLPAAHAQLRPIDRVWVWGRSHPRAEQAAQGLRAQGMNAEAAPSLEEAVEQADIVSCATLSHEPLVRGDWLRPGTHVDLVGAYTPAMRETDARVFERAHAVWCDTREGALREAGDILQAIEAGAFDADRLAGDLAALCRAESARRPEDITVFKSVGMAVEDLAAANLCVAWHAGRAAAP